MPTDMRQYPANWKTEIRPAILKRAKNKCEWCGVVNGGEGFRDGDGFFWSVENFVNAGWGELDKRGVGNNPITIVLTIAHIDNPDPMDCRSENLAALCQQCHHNSHDTPQHRAWARKKHDEKVGQLRMFE